MRRLSKALAYFATEAWQSLWRSWRISLVAILTISVSLFLCGGFLVTFRNVSQTLGQWRREVAVTVYLTGQVSAEEREDVRFVLGAPAWVDEVVEVGRDEALRRFRQTFPRLAELTGVWEGDLFPPSLEAGLDSARIDAEQFDSWIEGLRIHPAVLMVDADLDWLDRLAAAVKVLRLGGILLGAVFVIAAALTTASILRLIAHAHREEIAIMRLVGATEFYIRGPFYFEGLFQGLAGAVLAVVGVWSVFWALTANRSPWAEFLFSRPAGARDAGVMLAAGAVIGLSGAVLSLRRESFRPQGLD